MGQMRDAKFHRALTARCAVLACMLAGCSTGYAPPPPSAAASLQLVNQTAIPMVAYLYDEAAECKGRRVLAELKPHEQRTVLVPGGQDVAFAITHDLKLDTLPYDRVTTGCIVTLAFKPELGASYAFRMDSDGYRCVYQFHEASKAKEGLAAQAPFIKREALRATSEAGPFCRK